VTCKNICEKYRAKKPFSTITRYGTGQKRCQGCEIFINWDGNYCPCCGYKLRVNPRRTKHKEDLQVIRQVTRI